MRGSGNAHKVLLRQPQQHAAGLLFNVQKLSKMDKTQKRQAATRPAWGAVAVIGAMVAVTMGDSLTMAAIGTIMLVLGAWLGGYMNETSQKLRKTSANAAKAVERRAA